MILHGEDADAVERQAADLGVADSVEFHGSFPRSDVPAMLNTGVSLIKNSAYLSAIGVQELAGVAFDFGKAVTHEG